VALSLVLATMCVSAAQEQPPRFKAAVEVTSIDVTVVDDRGQPIPDLTPADFIVRIDGRERRAVSAEWVPLTSEVNGPAAFVPEGYSTNENASGGRLIVLAVDQPNIRFGGARAIGEAANAFVDRLTPSDRIAVIGFGAGAPATPFTADRARVKAALARMNGQKQAAAQMARRIALAEAQAIDRGDRSTLEAVEDRECGGSNGRASAGSVDLCRSEVEAEAQELARTATRESDQTLRGLRDLLTGLKAVDAPKTLILISEGFVLDDVNFTMEVGGLASAARTSVYALQLDQQLFDAAGGASPASVFADRDARAQGLQTLVSTARGTVMTVAGSGASFFARLEAELSGYYLVAVESDPRDRDGKPHPIRIDVPRRGVTVRARRQLTSTVEDARPRTPREAVTAGLGSPLLLSALPLRVAAFALRGPEAGKIQLLIHADVGTEYTASKLVSVGYMLFDQSGRVVDSQSADARIGPVLNGVPSPLQYTAGASVPPGDYTLKLAMAEGDKAGSVEHPIHAAIEETKGIALSELMVGGPAGDADPLRPTIGYTVSFGAVHGYLEAYAPSMDGLKVRYEIAPAADGAALLSADATAHVAGARALFGAIMPVSRLPAGRYVMRATISNGGSPLATRMRAFEVAPPAVLMTSAEGASASPSADAELFLPVDDGMFARPFHREGAVSAETLKPFRERVPQAARNAFDTGAAMITAGDYPKAEAALKRAIQPDLDSTAPLIYLGVCFAAAGHDAEAASVWQTALVDGGDIPQVYEWLGDALLRVHDLSEARTVYEEAVGKWPSDPRFTRPLALVDATFGRGRDAVRLLQRYLTARPDDRDALFLAIEWIYTVRAAGGVVQNRAEDVRLARAYAAEYEKAGGPQLALVKQWMAFLEK